MPIPEFLLGVTVPVFSVFAALRCIRLVDAPSRWIEASPGAACPMVRPEVDCQEQGTHHEAIPEWTSARSGVRGEPGFRRRRGEATSVGARGGRRRIRLAIGADAGINAVPPGHSGTLADSPSPMDGDGLSTGPSPSVICEIRFADGWLDA
jgi:hypothetical protein